MPHVLELPALPADASPDQGEAWLAAFARAHLPSAAEHAASWVRHAALFRAERDRALRASERLAPADPKYVCLHALADIAELHAQRCDAEAQRIDPLPF